MMMNFQLVSKILRRKVFAGATAGFEVAHDAVVRPGILPHFHNSSDVTFEAQDTGNGPVARAHRESSVQGCH